MARLVGVDLPREKRLEVALTYIYGVGRTRAQAALAATGVSPDLRVKDMTDSDLVRVLQAQTSRPVGLVDSNGDAVRLVLQT